MPSSNLKPEFRAAFGTNPAPAAESKNFVVPKAGRYSARFFQVVTAILAASFCANISDDFYASTSTYDLSNWIWLFAVMSPILSIFLVGIYAFSWLGKSFTSKKILLIEGACDATACIIWLSLLIAAGVRMGDACPPLKNASCDKYNWMLTWMAVTSVSWLLGLIFDVSAYAQGVWGYGERLDDIELQSNASIQRAIGKSGKY